MVEASVKYLKVKPHELSNRFRSKEDIHRYLSQQRKLLVIITNLKLVGVFLPTLHGTSVDFMRDILNDKKSHLKSNEVIHLEVPCYNEISVKNLYNDALADPELQKYLPSKK